MMFEFGEYGFIKWNFKFWNFLSENLKISIFDRSKLWIDRSKIVKKKLLEFLDVSIAVWFQFDLSKSNFRPIENHETGFSTEFFGGCSEKLKRFQALLTVLWNIFNSPYVPFDEPMDINRGLCSLHKIVS